MAKAESKLVRLTSTKKYALELHLANGEKLKLPRGEGSSIVIPRETWLKFAATDAVKGLLAPNRLSPGELRPALLVADA